MYSRKTGIMYNPSETQKKIDNFNKNLREQYRQKSIPTQSTATQSNKPAVSPSNDIISNITSLLTNDDIIIIGLIMLLLHEERKDYLLIGVLGALLFLSR